MHGGGGHVWLEGMHGRGACVAGYAWQGEGYAWQGEGHSWWGWQGEGHAWQGGMCCGVCMAGGHMHGRGRGIHGGGVHGSGMHGWGGGAHVWQEGMHAEHVWQERQPLQQMVRI